MIKTHNLWEADRARKLTTVAQVEAEIARCAGGIHAAPTMAKRRDWERKVAWLHKLHPITDNQEDKP